MAFTDRLRALLPGGGGASVTVTVYGRSPCGLCDKAVALLAAEAPRATVVHVDIDTDDDLLRAYHVRVPVLEVDGEVLVEGAVRPGEIRDALRRRRR